MAQGPGRIAARFPRRPQPVPRRCERNLCPPPAWPLWQIVVWQFRELLIAGRKLGAMETAARDPLALWIQVTETCNGIVCCRDRVATGLRF